QAEQVVLRVAPAPVPTEQIAVGREAAVGARVGVGRALRLRVDLQAHVAADPVIATTGPAQRPAVETNGSRATPLTNKANALGRSGAGPAAIDLHVAGGLLLDSRR